MSVHGLASIRYLRLCISQKSTTLTLLHSQAKIDPQSVTLAIQTLRNTILVAIFIGGFSFQYAFETLNSLDTSSSKWQICRAAIVSALLFCSFLCWANVIRCASHLGYYIGTLGVDPEVAVQIEDGIAAVGTEDSWDKGEEANQLLSTAFKCFSFGFRFLFISIPFMFFNIGPLALVVSTFMLLVFLFVIDNNRK